MYLLSMLCYRDPPTTSLPVQTPIPRLADAIYDNRGLRALRRGVQLHGRGARPVPEVYLKSIRSPSDSREIRGSKIYVGIVCSGLLRDLTEIR